MGKTKQSKEKKAGKPSKKKAAPPDEEDEELAIDREEAPKTDLTPEATEGGETGAPPGGAGPGPSSATPALHSKDATETEELRFQLEAARAELHEARETLRSRDAVIQQLQAQLAEFHAAAAAAAAAAPDAQPSSKRRRLSKGGGSGTQDEVRDPDARARKAQAQGGGSQMTDLAVASQLEDVAHRLKRLLEDVDSLKQDVRAAAVPGEGEGEGAAVHAQ